LTDVLHEEKELPEIPSESIHSFFGLSYANYLVVPRTLLQSMPDEWQYKFVELLHEMWREFPQVDLPNYYVQALARDIQRITEYIECEDCKGTGRDSEDDEEECEWCNGTGEVEGEERWETPEEAGIINDPVPHYWRGRTRLRRASEPEDVKEITPSLL
jgi:hypothetical protein